MWKKDETPEEPARPRAETGRSPQRPAASRPTGERAAIGRSITIKGEVTGDEDLLIQGRVDGSVDLDQHAVTVGPDGDVKASITARVVTIEGSVEGDLTAEEQVVLRSSARVQGDIAAPRVVLEDGARFRGGVDMGEAPAQERRSRAPISSPSRSAPDGADKTAVGSAGAAGSAGSAGSGSSSGSAGSTDGRDKSTSGATK